MNNRIHIPSGNAGLFLLAIALAPLVLKKCKPVAKALGENLVKAGEAVQKMAAQS
jgi:hypothetical protein